MPISVPAAFTLTPSLIEILNAADDFGTECACVVEAPVAQPASSGAVDSSMYRAHYGIEPNKAPVFEPKTARDRLNKHLVAWHNQLVTVQEENRRQLEQIADLKSRIKAGIDQVQQHRDTQFVAERERDEARAIIAQLQHELEQARTFSTQLADRLVAQQQRARAASKAAGTKSATAPKRAKAVRS